MTGHILIGRSRESLALGRSAGFQTGLKRMGGWVDTLQPEDTLAQCGNRRSAKVCAHAQRFQADGLGMEK